MEKLGQDSVVNRERRVVCISQDSFYRELSPEERALAFKGNFDFDHPSAFDEQLMLNTLRDIVVGKVVSVPKYNFKEHTQYVIISILITIQLLFNCYSIIQLLFIYYSFTIHLFNFLNTYSSHY